MTNLLRKITLLGLIFALGSAASFADMKYRVLLWEDFSKFTAGSEEKPSTTTVNDGFQSIPSNKTLSPGWQGVEIYQAGGAAYQGAGGRLFTPDLVLSENGGTFRVTFKMKLAKGSPVGIANVVHSNISSYEGPELTEEWQTISVEMSGGIKNDFICIRGVGVTAEAWNKVCVLIDDVLVEVPDPVLKSPESLSYGDFDGSSFTATWKSVEGATGYDVRVYTLSGESTPNYVISDITTESTTVKITGLEEKWKDYYFQVRAFNADESSPWSSPLLIEGLPAPLLKDETNISPQSFTASWDAVPGTYAYEILTYYQHTAKGDEQFYHIDTDFSFVTQQELTSGFDAGFDELPGWFFGCADLQDGYIGVQGAMAYLGYAAQVESPALNLASSGGKLSVEFKAKNDDARTAVAVALYNPYNGDFRLADSEEFELSKNWHTVRVSLTGGIDGSILAFIPTRSGNVYFDDVKVWQNLKEGAIGSFVANVNATQRTSVKVDNLNCPEGDEIAYKVRAKGVSADNSRWIYSAYSPLRYPYGHNDVEDICVPVEAPEIITDGLSITVAGAGEFSVYNLSGQKIVSGLCGEPVLLPSKGFFIVTTGSYSTKILIH